MKANVRRLVIINLIVQCKRIGRRSYRLIKIRAAIASVRQRTDLLSPTFRDAFGFFYSRLHGVLFLRVVPEIVHDFPLAGNESLF